MFGVVSQFLSHLLHGTRPEDNINAENRTENEEFSSRTQSESDNRNASGAKFETGELKKVFFGKVTKLYDNSGLIDDEVYFDFDKVIGGERPSLNSEVQVEATRVSTCDGWRADHVHFMTTDWDDLGDKGIEEVLIGDITDMNEKDFVISYDTHCPMASLAFGYAPCTGDWVRAEVLRDRGLVCNVKVVKPLREKSLTGIVTSIGYGHGYINTDIFFSFGVCRTNYVPRKGHTVRVTAIESNQGNCKWRALKVEPKAPRRETNLPPITRTGPRVEGKFTQKLLQNKEGVMITNEINFSDVTLGQKQEAVIYIRNDGMNSVVLKSVDGLMDESLFRIHLIDQETMGNNLKDEMSDSGRLHFDIQIDPQKSIEFKIIVDPRLLGEFNQLVVFNFGKFQIGRFFIANVRDKHQHLLDAKTPYNKRKFIDKKEALNKVLDTKNHQTWVIPGQRPMFKQKSINISTTLSYYEIPKTLRQFVLNKMDVCSVVPCLTEPPSIRNYKERFSALLHVEETQMELEMREFDLEQVSLKPAREYLSLSVPGLAEGRPSLLIGDRVILCVSGTGTNSPKYEGFIHEVLNTEVLLKFHEDFHTTYDMDTYDVMFFFNRTPLRRCHKALESANHLGEKVLFPNEILPKLPQELNNNNKELFNSKLNERQRAAVSRILIGQSRPMPYVLFGPPGTGKTVTLVEAILQIFHRISSSRILACAPSNSAADLIAERLHHSGVISEGDMVRLNAFQRQQNIPEDIENYSTNIEKLDIAAHYRIVICTCTTTGQLHTLGLGPGHFTHVLIDEAGQATEPESLVPISFMAGTDGQIVLAGDPYQLGAVLRSRISQAYGLNISLLERLMSRTPYLRDEARFSDHGCYDPLAVTKLVNNYRSHEALIQLPSQLFYHAEMIPCADENVKNCLCDWEKLPNKNGFPVLFHGIKGEDLREGNSPSWFNAVEAVQVLKYVQELRKLKKHPVKLDDIGIITPYRKQVEKIRLLLNRFGLSEIKVGSVEEFQGQERLVIIISTVRSCEKLIGFDYTHNIGFLSNPKRFNVAITRAQALMIVIGNPHVLVKDTNWRALLQYCWVNNSYIGCDLPPLKEHIENDFEECGSMLNGKIARHRVAHHSDSTEKVEGTSPNTLNAQDEGNEQCLQHETQQFLNTNRPFSSNFSSQYTNERLQSTVYGSVYNTATVYKKGVTDGIHVDTVDSLDGSSQGNRSISMDTTDAKSKNVLKRGPGDFSNVKVRPKDIVGSTRDTGCLYEDTHDTSSGSQQDTSGASDLHARNTNVFTRDYLDIKGQDGVSRVGKRISHSHRGNTNDCLARNFQNQSNGSAFNGRDKDNQMFTSGQTIDSTNKRTVFNSYESQTPTQHNCSDSSDEDPEEIVYKGEMD